MKKIYLYDLFEKYSPKPFEKVKKVYEKYHPVYDIGKNESKDLLVNIDFDKFELSLSQDGKITITKNDEDKITLSNIQVLLM